jgi:hypothetical protein
VLQAFRNEGCRELLGTMPFTHHRLVSVVQARRPWGCTVDAAAKLPRVWCDDGAHMTTLRWEEGEQIERAHLL